MRGSYQHHHHWIPFDGGYALMLNGDLGYAPRLRRERNCRSTRTSTLAAYRVGARLPAGTSARWSTDSNGNERVAGRQPSGGGQTPSYFPMPGPARARTSPCACLRDGGCKWGADDKVQDRFALQCVGFILEFADGAAKFSWAGAQDKKTETRRKIPVPDGQRFSDIRELKMEVSSERTDIHLLALMLAAIFGRRRRRGQGRFCQPDRR